MFSPFRPETTTRSHSHQRPPTHTPSLHRGKVASTLGRAFAVKGRRAWSPCLQAQVSADVETRGFDASNGRSLSLPPRDVLTVRAPLMLTCGREPFRPAERPGQIYAPARIYPDEDLGKLRSVLLGRESIPLVWRACDRAPSSLSLSEFSRQRGWIRCGLIGGGNGFVRIWLLGYLGVIRQYRFYFL